MCPARPIVFLSDYGLEDEFVGVCHAVMAKISPESPVIDLTHAVPPQDVLAGALILSDAIRFLPTEAIVVGVVDPGVGTPRRPIAVETKQGARRMVAPDNGLLSLAWTEIGGLNRAAEITSPEVVLLPLSATFHGRDIFAPAAAHLALDFPFEKLGPSVDVESLVSVMVPEPAVADGAVDCQVLSLDRYGNVQLSARLSHLEQAGIDRVARLSFRARGAGLVEIRQARTFGDVTEGELGLIVDSSGWLEIVVNRGSAAEALAVAAGDPVTLLRSRAVA
jgi:S-adenosyl-L-methionine hydrolase (adenosine-forming)